MLNYKIGIRWIVPILSVGLLIFWIIAGIFWSIRVKNRSP